MVSESQIYQTSSARERLKKFSNTYKMFVEYNAQQEINDPSGPRISETLVTKAKNVRIFDAVFMEL